MAFKFMDAGSVLQTASTMKVKDGSTLRRILRMKVMDTDDVTLLTVATFVQPLTAAISSTTSYIVVGRDPVTHEPTEYDVTYAATATPSGGLGPYTYSWAITSGSGWSISTPATASTSINGNTSSSASGAARVTVSDSSGQTATADIDLSTFIA